MSSALLPVRLDVCVRVTPPLPRSFLHCWTKAVTFRMLIILGYVDANVFPNLYIAFPMCLGHKN